MKTITSSVGFKDPQGNLVASGFLILELSQAAEVTSGGGLIAPKRVVVSLTSLAVIPPATQLFANDELTPSGTTYHATLLDSSQNLIADFGHWSISGASPIDVSLIVPVSSGGTVSVPGVVLLSPSSSQTITQPSGTSLTISGPFNANGLKNLDEVRFVDNSNNVGWSGANAGAWIASAIGDLPSTGGVVDARGLGANTHTISSQLDIGSSTKPVTLIINPATQFQITINSASTDAIRVFNGSHIMGLGTGGASDSGNQANFTVISGASVNSLIANSPQTGTQEFFSLSNLTLRSSSGSTVAKGLVYLSGIFAGSFLSNIYTVLCAGGGSALYVTSPTGGVLNITSDVTFANCNFDCGSASGAGPAVTITTGAASSATGGLNFFGCQIQHPGSNQPCIKIDGAGSGQCGQILFSGLHTESGASLATTGPHITINDAHNVHFSDWSTSGATPTAGNLITIAQATANSTHNIFINNGRIASGALTNVVSSSVTGIPNLAYAAGADGAMSIEYWSGLTANHLVGGPVSIVGATSGSTKVQATATASGTLTLPAATDTLVAKATTDTLTNKTLTGATSGNSVTLLNQQKDASAIVGTGADATVYTYTLPANTLQAGKGLRIKVYWLHSTGTASVSYKLKFGSTTHTAFSSSGTAVEMVWWDIYNNSGVTNAQNSSNISFIATAFGIGANTSSAVDFTASQAIAFTFNVANTDQVTPKFWSVELIQ